jgi:hypothetical protein
VRQYPFTHHESRNSPPGVEPEVTAYQTAHAAMLKQAILTQGDLLVKKLNSVALVRKRTIPTEQPHVGEVSAKFSGYRLSRGQHNGSPRPLISIFYTRSRYLSLQVAPQLYSRGYVNPVPDPILLRKFGSAGNRTRDLWICSQEL